MRELGSSVLLVAAIAAASLGSRASRAAGPPPVEERRAPYSPYERQTIDAAVKKAGGTVDPSPQGKILEAVDVTTLDVFEPRDPMPSLVMPLANWFHVTTRRSIIEREVLLAPGERYDQALVDETARNLRGFHQLSLVLCVALRGSAPDRVRLLVITKDVWSLRLNSSYTFENGRLQYLLLQPSEENLLGTHQAVLGNFVLDPATIALGLTYTSPRIAGSRVRGSASAGVILNRETGRPEGSSGSLNYGQPLYSTRAAWAWVGGIGWDYEIRRRFIGGLFTDFDPASGLCAVPAAPVSAGAPDPRRCQYRRDTLGGSYAVTRSFGTAWKHNLSLGFSANRRVYTTFDGNAFSPADHAAFLAAYVPVTDTQIGPYLEYHDFSSRFVDVLDFDTMGLTENIRRGHDVTLRISPVTTALNSSRNLIDVFAAASYTLPIGDGLVRGAVSADTSITTGPSRDGTPQEPVPDAYVDVSARVATPRFGFGRLMFDFHMLDRYKNYLNAKTTLGGDGRLRGYPAQMFVGKNFLVANLEYRSDPIEIYAVQLGWALFVDTGDAFDSFDQMRLKQGTGFGLRALFPQLQRTVMRVDVGFPLTPSALPASQYHADVVVTFGQVIPELGN